MTLFTTDYLEYYLTLVSWIVHNGIWAVLVSSGVFALPFVAIIVQEWLKARSEGADEGNKGVLSAARIENRVFVAIVVVMFAGIPFIDVDLNTIQYDSSRSAQCQVSVPQPTDTGWSQSFSTLNNQSAKVPVWWGFMHALSRAVTGASVAAIPCGTDLRQMRMEIDATRIGDPVLAQDVADFTHDCYGPARANLFMQRPQLDEAQMHDRLAAAAEAQQGFGLYGLRRADRQDTAEHRDTRCWRCGACGRSHWSVSCYGCRASGRADGDGTPQDGARDLYPASAGRRHL